MTSRATALGVPLDGPIALTPFTVDEDSTLLALNDLTQAHAKACGRNSATVSCIVLAVPSAVEKGKKRDRSSSSTPSATSREARGLPPAILDWPCVSSRLAVTPADLTLAARDEPARASPNSSRSFSSDLPLPPAKLPRTGDSLQLSLVSSALSAPSASHGNIANPSSFGAMFPSEPASNFPLTPYAFTSFSSFTYTPSPEELRTNAIFEETRAHLRACRKSLEEWPEGWEEKRG
ncbi:hypothetical protein JCM11641_002107 [Rhodosporidiobolus odoratus]